MEWPRSRVEMHHRSSWPCFLKGQEGRTHFTLLSYAQALLTRIRWQVAIPEGCGGWTNPCHPRFRLCSADNFPLSQSLKSHTVPIRFLIFFLFSSYCPIAKVILPPLFLFFSIFLVPICHRWKRNTRQCNIAKLNLVHQAKGRAASGKATHTGAYTHRINWGLHRAHWVGTVKPRGTWCSLCPTCLCVGLWAAAQHHVWWFHLEQSASMKCWTSSEQCLRLVSITL